MITTYMGLGFNVFQEINVQLDEQVGYLPWMLSSVGLEQNMREVDSIRLFLHANLESDHV